MNVVGYVKEGVKRIVECGKRKHLYKFTWGLFVQRGGERELAASDNLKD